MLKDLPPEKQWEMYDILKANCNGCSKWKKDIDDSIFNLKLFVGIVTALGTFLYGTLLFVGGFFQGSLNFLVHK